MTAAGLSNLVVEVLHNRGDDKRPDWSVGSGFFVSRRLVLTALHNVDGPGELLVRVHGKEEHPAVVRLQGDKDIADLAVLELSDVPVDVPPLRYGVVDRSAPAVVKGCRAVGFPRFKERVQEPKPLRLSAQVDGEIPTGENLNQPLLTLLVTRSPRPLLSSAVRESEWAGMSGAAVFSGNNILVGVITEHHLPEGERALTVVPITALDLLPEAEATKWWKLLGVDHQALVPLPGFNLPADVEQQNRSPDWGGAPDVPVFFGRTKELHLLEQWIVHDRCRLVALVGMGGVGKTGLSVKLGRGGIGKTELSLKLARGIEEQFDYVIWRRLLNAPKVSELLIDLIKFLSNQQEVTLSDTVSEQISRLLHYLQKSRCLVILDNAEMLLQGGKQVGQYLPGYEEYGQLFEQIAEIPHQSCLLG